MMYMIIIVLSILVAVNFILLIFSCNKSNQTRKYSKPFVIKKGASTITTQRVPTRLAPTGS